MSTRKPRRPARSGSKSKKRPQRRSAPKPPTEFEIVFVDGLDSGRTGPAHKRRLALRIDGEDKDVVSLRLDSDQARSRQVKKWAASFGLDLAGVEENLRRAAVTVTAEVQQRQLAAIDARLRRAEVGGAESPPVTPDTLDEVRHVYGKWIADIDPDLLDVVFGTVFAHRLDGDPVWTFVIAAPGDSKTEILRSLSAHELVCMLSSLTPGALISGFVPPNENTPDPSLLPKLDGKILVVKDFTAVLTMPNEARTEILGTLRDAYDGEAGKAFGTGELKRYKSRFGLLAAVTPVIENYWGVAAQLGERFLRFRIPSRGREAKVKRALANANAETAMRAELSRAALRVLAQASYTPTIPANIADRLIHLADFVARARSEISRDRQGVVQYAPAIEVGTRIGKALKKLAMGVAVARGAKAVDEDIYRIVRRVALDCVPSMRTRLLGVLWRLHGAHELTAVIADRAELATDTAKSWLDDLRLLGIVDRGCPGTDVRSGYSWRIKTDVQRTIERFGGLDTDADYEPVLELHSTASDDGVGGAPPDSAPLTSASQDSRPGMSGVQNHSLPASNAGQPAANLLGGLRDAGRNGSTDDPGGHSNDGGQERETIQVPEAEAKANDVRPLPGQEGAS